MEISLPGNLKFCTLSIVPEIEYNMEDGRARCAVYQLKLFVYDIQTNGEGGL